MSHRSVWTIGVLGLIACLILGILRYQNPKTVRVVLDMDAGRAAISMSTVPVSVNVISSNAGSVKYVASRKGQGLAASFPEFGSGKHAVLAVSSRDGAGDPLSPADRDFSFGADFKTTAKGYLDGDNLIQRGLADDEGQYKLEIDERRPVCRMQGSSSLAIVKAGEQVRPGVWYSAVCSRTSKGVTLAVKRFDNGGSWTTSKNEHPGRIVTAQSTTPLTIGGKVTPQLKIAGWEPDTFNGQVDNAFLQIG